MSPYSLPSYTPVSDPYVSSPGRNLPRLSEFTGLRGGGGLGDPGVARLPGTKTGWILVSHTRCREIRAARGCRGHGPPPSCGLSSVQWRVVGTAQATRSALHPPERVLRRGALEGRGLGAQVDLLFVGLPRRLHGWWKSLKGRHPGLLLPAAGAGLMGAFDRRASDPHSAASAVLGFQGAAGEKTHVASRITGLTALWSRCPPICRWACLRSEPECLGLAICRVQTCCRVLGIVCRGRMELGVGAVGGGPQPKSPFEATLRKSGDHVWWAETGSYLCSPSLCCGGAHVLGGEMCLVKYEVAGDRDFGGGCFVFGGQGHLCHKVTFDPRLVLGSPGGRVPAEGPEVDTAQSSGS